jgi:thiamine pyrophosphate-dependent acetolactate synthase large subunit-like protein
VVDEALTSTRALRGAIGPRTAATWMAHRGSALGWGLPAAVGARIADPSRRVLALQGDGSLLFGVSALWTAARQGTGGPALVVADNGGYEILRAGLEGLTGRAESAWPGLALGAPLDLVAICRGFGATAERADRAEALDDALADLWSRAEDGPAVLVVAVEGRTPAVGYPVEAS